MPLTRSLLLKGLGGVTAAGAVSVGAYGATHPNKFADLFKSQNQINEEKAEKEKREEIMERVKNLLPEDCHLENNSFTDSTSFSKDCTLDRDKFRKIKFFDGGDAVTVDGFNEGNTVSLTVSNGEENGIKVLIKEVKDDLTISKSAEDQSNKITIRSNKETKFEEENGRLVKVVDHALKTKLEEINKRLVTLVLPENCGFDVTEKDESIECPLSSEALKKIVFSNRGSEDVTLKPSETVPADLKIKVERKDENISFSFLNLPSTPITIFGDKSRGKIVLKGESKFRDVNGQLTKGTPDEALKTLNEQLGTVNAPLECRFDEAESDASVECDITEDKFKALEFSNKPTTGELTVKTWPDSGAVKLKAAKDGQSALSISFTGVTSEINVFGDKGKIVLKNSETKFSVQEGKLTKGTANADLKKFNKQLGTINAPIECRFDESESDTSVECNITEAEFKALNFSNKGEGDLKVVGWNGNENVKLKAEKGTANEMSLSFQNVTSQINVFGDKGKIVIKNSPETKFKVIDDKLTKENPDAELKKFNEQLGKVKAPVECRFDESETGETVECSVSKDDLKKMIFSKDQGDLTYSDGGDFQNMKLVLQFNVEDIVQSDLKTKEEKKVMNLTFKDYDRTVKLSKDDREIISLIKNTNPEFVVGKDENDSEVLVLEKKWKPTSFMDLLSLECSAIVGQTYEECTSTTKNINVSKGNGEEFEALNIFTYKFELHKDQENYNQGYKFVYKGGNARNGNDGVSLEQEGWCEFKWKTQNKGKVGYLVKRDKRK